MKLISFEREGQQCIGAVTPESEVVDLTTAGPGVPFRSMLALIDAGEDGLDQARQMLDQRKRVHALDSVRVLSPLPRPRQLRDFLCFEKHFRQSRARAIALGVQGKEPDPAKGTLPQIWYEEPIYYKCNRMSVVGTGADVVMPSYTKMLDFELEFGIVTGRKAKNVSRDEARSLIFGYTIFNDFSARDQQLREMQGTLGPTKGKDFDTGNVLGPFLVTADEVPDPYDLTMVARVNGETWCRGSSGEMHHRFEDILVHVARDETIYPGEFFGSGTVGGGCGLEHGKFLQPGDVVELEVQGLGTLVNRIVAHR